MLLTKYKLWQIPAVASLLMMSASGIAADGTINFTGEFITSTCDIKFDNGTNIAEVNLGTYNTAALANMGDLTASKEIKISLTACPVKDKNINLEFTANNTTADGHTYKVIGNSAISASDIGVALFKDNAQVSQIIPASTQVPVTLTDDTGNATIYASFKRIQNNGALMADKVKSTATFNINYL